MNNYIDRIIRAIKLDGSLYAEVAADRNSLGQAIGIVALSSLASGMGLSKGGVEIVSIMILVFVVWWVWSLIAYTIGTRLLAESQTHVDYLGLLRAVGFAHAPGILQICGLIPVPTLRVLASVFITIWTLIAIVVSLRQALSYTTLFRAIGLFLLSSIAQGILFWTLTFFVGGGRPA
jgi:hypothetical protein